MSPYPGVVLEPVFNSIILRNWEKHIITIASKARYILLFIYISMQHSLWNSRRNQPSQVADLYQSRKHGPFEIGEVLVSYGSLIAEKRRKQAPVSLLSWMSRYHQARDCQHSIFSFREQFHHARLIRIFPK